MTHEIGVTIAGFLLIIFVLCLFYVLGPQMLRDMKEAHKEWKEIFRGKQ